MDGARLSPARPACGPPTRRTLTTSLVRIRRGCRLLRPRPRRGQRQGPSAAIRIRPGGRRRGPAVLRRRRCSRAGASYRGHRTPGGCSARGALVRTLGSAGRPHEARSEHRRRGELRRDRARLRYLQCVRVVETLAPGCVGQVLVDPTLAETGLPGDRLHARNARGQEVQPGPVTTGWRCRPEEGRASAPAPRCAAVKGPPAQAAAGRGAVWARPAASTIRATRPSPRMVAPETPAMRR
jgi:hypothetical protein